MAWARLDGRIWNNNWSDIMEDRCQMDKMPEECNNQQLLGEYDFLYNKGKEGGMSYDELSHYYSIGNELAFREIMKETVSFKEYEEKRSKKID